MIHTVINKIKNDLVYTFDDVFKWFKSDCKQLDYSPEKGGWSIRLILEHISITNHYLLILIRKGTLKTLEKAKHTDYTTLVEDYDLDWNRMKAIGETNSFEWNRPEHMKPLGNVSLQDVQ